MTPSQPSRSCRIIPAAADHRNRRAAAIACASAIAGTRSLASAARHAIGPFATDLTGAHLLDKVEWWHIGNYMKNERKCIYLVTFERESAYRGQTFTGRGTLCIPVLLDGRVIQGKME
jgi:hypothetical protein